LIGDLQHILTAYLVYHWWVDRIKLAEARHV